jgi:hypothetical protein
MGVVRDGVLRLLEVIGAVDIDLFRPAYKVTVNDSIHDRLACYRRLQPLFRVLARHR